MKSLQDIYDEWLGQRSKEETRLNAKLREASAEKDTILQRAGIRDRPEDLYGDDADRWIDEDYYRCRVREMVFKVPDVELRKQVMLTLSGYRYELYDQWRVLNLFDENFTSRLRHERCRPPRLSYTLFGTPLIAIPLAFIGVAAWFDGTLVALLVAVCVLLPSLVFLAVSHYTDLHQYDVIMQQAIQTAERNAAASKAEATRRLHLPKLFSRREQRTGEADRPETAS
jgi:hypothetical protein